MCDWPKSDCDVSVTDRQTNTLRAPPTRARAGFARARPGVRGNKNKSGLKSKLIH